MEMRNYLNALIEEKGRSLDDSINLDGHFGLTWEVLVDFIDANPDHHEAIRCKLVAIDFHNGDVFHFLTHLAKGMVASMGY